MSVDYGLLQTLHRMLRQINDLKGRISRGPTKVRIVKAAEVKFEEELEEAKTALTSARMAANQKQLQLGEREAKIEGLKNKLNGAASNREFQLLKDQIAADDQANSVLSDEILELLEKIDTLEADLETAKSNLAKGVSETKRISDNVEQETKNLTKDLEDVTAELAESEKLIPGELQIEYRRLVIGMGEEALASTDTQTCNNCNQHLTAQTVSELMLKQPVFCKGCGSWMYVTENLAMGR